MNPSAHPLQPRNEWVPVQTGGPAGVQYTTQEKDHIIWSIFNLIYCNPFCLGLGAFISSIKARDRKMVGDVEGARQHSNTAFYLNIAATILVSLTVIITIIVMIALAASVSSAYRRY